MSDGITEADRCTRELTEEDFEEAQVTAAVRRLEAKSKNKSWLNGMNFDKDYKEFIDHLKKTCALRPMKLDRDEDVAVRLFVAYLNIRYAKTSANQAMHSDGEGRCISSGMCKMENNCKTRECYVARRR